VCRDPPQRWTAVCHVVSGRVRTGWILVDASPLLLHNPEVLYLWTLVMSFYESGGIRAAPLVRGAPVHCGSAEDGGMRTEMVWLLTVRLNLEPKRSETVSFSAEARTMRLEMRHILQTSLVIPCVSWASCMPKERLSTWGSLSTCPQCSTVLKLTSGVSANSCPCLLSK
jgi:hypothetical protein